MCRFSQNDWWKVIILLAKLDILNLIKEYYGFNRKDPENTALACRLSLACTLAAAGFVIVDMTNGNNGGGMGSKTLTIGKVAGEFDYLDFARAERSTL
ncbi:MAG: hypothetical protein IPJ39_22195 [Saprospiraceae bacterium]|nr:hypothetical protein [Saprospiraceae bacterium]